MRVVRLGSGQIGHVGIEIFAAGAAAVLRVGEQDFARPTVDEVAEVVKFAGENLLSPAAFAATWTRPMREISAAFDDFGLGQVLWISDPFGWIRQIFAGAEHGRVLHDQEFLAQRLPYSAQFVMMNLR
jgi:hypothetical protein